LIIPLPAAEASGTSAAKATPSASFGIGNFLLLRIYAFEKKEFGFWKTKPIF